MTGERRCLCLACVAATALDGLCNVRHNSQLEGDTGLRISPKSQLVNRWLVVLAVLFSALDLSAFSPTGQLERRTGLAVICLPLLIRSVDRRAPLFVFKYVTTFVVLVASGREDGLDRVLVIGSVCGLHV